MSSVSRREFLQATAAGSAVVIGVSLAGCRSEPLPPSGGDAAFVPDAWIRIGSDGRIEVMVDRSEMGQGVSTALPMLVAEELDADWSQVSFAFAPAHSAYDNQLIGAQITGGSTSVMNAWVPLREGAAKARAMLVAAAAAEWGVPAGECRTERGAVVHESSGRSQGYGALAARAALQPAPTRVALKQPAEFRIIGKPVRRLDMGHQVTGQVTFGMDVRPPDALVAVVARCPVFGGRVRRFDPAPAMAVPGVRQVLAIPQGVAVVADTTWQALQGRQALTIEWDEGGLAGMSSADLESRLRTLGAQRGREARRDGQGAAGLDAAAQVVTAEYDLPFLAHACMEPMNATALVTPDEVVVWAPTQNQAAPALFGGGSRGVAAKVAGVSQDRVTVHTTNLGGGFGRRSETDFVAEAVAVARRTAGVPVRLVWTREDDIRHDFYRPVSHHVLKGGLSADGRLQAWSHHIVSPSITDRFVPGFIPDWVMRLGGPLKGGIDHSAVEGAVDAPYAIPDFELRYTMADLGVPVGFWRSVGHSYTAFVVESFIDELAHAAGQDPVAFRLGLLGQAPRHRAVLQAAADRAGWGAPMPAGQGRGVAVHASFGSYAAQVAEVEVVEGAVRVRRVVCAFDCGVVVNPDTVEAQIQSAIVYGLSAALKSSVTLENGRVVQSNFHDYPVLRIDEMPAVEVVLVPSGDAPGGVGEPGLPPIAPAVANAVFAATGHRARRLPIELPITGSGPGPGAGLG